MAYKNIITYGSLVSQVIQDYYSPVSTVSGKQLTSHYAFLSRVDPWVNDSYPDQPTQDQQYIKSVFANMFVAKQITSNHISPVIQRVDWTTGIVYDYYQDNIDMFIKDSNGFLIRKFYVRNTYDQVFKCLWNNNGSVSTVMPMFQPGSYETNNIYTGGDGYKWKYMYTIDLLSKRNFLDINWMPVPIGTITSPNPNTSSAGWGDVEVINVTNGGSGYDASNTIIQVFVTGANSFPASANAYVTNGAITDIVVSNPGKNYTSANVTINVSTTANLVPTGTGATAIAPVSPVGGHGYNPISELGTSHVMYSVEFNGSESGVIPTDIDYHQIGILVSPISYSSNTSANGQIYNTSTQFTVAQGFGLYTNDEIVYQGTSLATASFTAKVLSYDDGSGIIKLINTVGIPTTSASVYGNTSKTTRTLLSYNNPDLIPYSGHIAYIENRSGIQRSVDGIEQFRIVLQY